MTDSRYPRTAPPAIVEALYFCGAVGSGLEANFPAREIALPLGHGIESLIPKVLGTLRVSPSGYVAGNPTSLSVHMRQGANARVGIVVWKEADAP